MEENATDIIRRALAGSGIEAIASCSAAAYDARAPEGYRSERWLPGARGLVVAASAGPHLWRAFRERALRDASVWEAPHPYDAFVAELLDRADRALAVRNIQYRRFEAGVAAPVHMNFVALGELVGLGSPGPFGLLIHPKHGPWWALRGAWLVDVEAQASPPPLAPCRGCTAPCVGGWEHAGSEIVKASPEVRSRCVVGQDGRYDEDQIAYHYSKSPI